MIDHRAEVGRPPEPPDALLRLVEEVRPSEIVVGIPFNMDGSEGEMAKETRQFADALAARTGVQVVEWDERLTSAQAERTLREAEAPPPSRRGGGRGSASAARGRGRPGTRRRSKPPARRRAEREEGKADMAAAALMLRGYLRKLASLGEAGRAEDEEPED